LAGRDPARRVAVAVALRVEREAGEVVESGGAGASERPVTWGARYRTRKSSPLPRAAASHSRPPRVKRNQMQMEMGSLQSGGAAKGAGARGRGALMAGAGAGAGARAFLTPACGRWPGGGGGCQWLVAPDRPDAQWERSRPAAAAAAARRSSRARRPGLRRGRGLYPSGRPAVQVFGSGLPCSVGEKFAFSTF
jgi:hypothetical protein